MDDADAGFQVLGGAWSVATGADALFGNYHFLAPGTAGERVRWTPDLGASGPYDVYAHWTAAANRATNAPYTINHAGGSTVVRVDQQVNGGSSTLWGPSSSSLGSAARWSCPPMPTASSSPTRSASARSQRRDEIGHYY